MFIYFSTISIQDPSLKSTAYVKHKLEMESLILNHPGAKIFRLGQLASKNMGNPNNLLNFLNDSTKKNKKIEIWANALRSIIDVDDVVKIVNYIITKKSTKEKIINICNPRLNMVKEIVDVFTKLHNKKIKYSLLDKGAFFQIESKLMMETAFFLDIKFNKSYLERVLRKYYLE